jgi:outer membrane protein insertion porin family
MMRRGWGVAAILVAAVAGWAQDEAPVPVVREIEMRFVGPETVNRAILNANTQTRVGQPFAAEVVEQDVRQLIATGYFTDVRVLQEPVSGGVKVVYVVQGKATLKEVSVAGYKQFKEDRLKRDLTLKAGDILDEQKVHHDCGKLIELYQKTGYPDVRVDPQIQVDPDTGKAVLRYQITEGPRVFIKDIVFVGNRAVPTSRGWLWWHEGLVKKIKTKRRWWGSWLADSGMLRDEQFKEDLETIRDYYRSLGYLDMEIRSTKIERVAPHWMVVRIEIFEGQQYKVGEVRLTGNRLFPTPELEKKLKMTTGKTFTPDGLSKDIKAIQDYYGTRGYIDTSVRSARVPNVETGRIDLTYTIAEGELTYIERIDIHGNTKTKDKVIRRELAVVPGEIYDTVRVDRSAARLKNLGYFSKVETMPEPTPVPGRKNLAITVEEQRTGSLTFGAGFSSIDNLIGYVEMTQGNFDLFNWPTFTGGGQKLRIKLTLGLKTQSYVLSFVEPWFLNQKLALGVDLSRTKASYLSDVFTETRTGGDIYLQKALNEFVRAEVKYALQEIKLDIDSDASRELASQAGTSLRSSVTLSLVHDSRDSVVLTTRGSRTEIAAEIVGGPFGGDSSVYKLSAKSTVYFPLFNNHVFQLLGAAAVVDAYGNTRGSGGTVTESNGTVVVVNDVPIYDRYFLGGANTLRGFGYRKISPKDVNGESVGGNTQVYGTAEYTFPIVDRVRGAVFGDIGGVWRDAYEFNGEDLKADVGIGLRLDLPIGQLRLDYGYPVWTDDSSGRSGRFQFGVGYQF